MRKWAGAAGGKTGGRGATETAYPLSNETASHLLCDPQTPTDTPVHSGGDGGTRSFPGNAARRKRKHGGDTNAETGRKRAAPRREESGRRRSPPGR